MWPIVALFGLAAILMMLSLIRPHDTRFALSAEAESVVLTFDRPSPTGAFLVDSIDIDGSVRVECDAVDDSAESSNSFHIAGQDITVSAVDFAEQREIILRKEGALITLVLPASSGEARSHTIKLVLPAAVEQPYCPPQPGEDFISMAIDIQPASFATVYLDGLSDDADLLPFASPQSLAFVEQLQVDDSRIETVGTIREGELWLEDFGALENKLGLSDKLVLEGVTEALMVQQQLTDRGIRFTAEGRASDIFLDRVGGIENLRPTMLDKAANSTLVRIVGAILTLLGGLQLGFFLREKEDVT